MMKENYLALIAERCSKIKDNYILLNIINTHEWYMKVDIEKYVNIMIAIGFSKEESLVIYKELLRR